MNLQHTWCLIERNGHFEVMSFESMQLLPEGSFVMLQNFESHQEAFDEHVRLVKLVVEDTKKKLDQ